MNGIKCGNCGKRHDTVLEVRLCHGAAGEADDAAQVLDEMEGNERTINPPSDKQIAYVHALIAEHEWPDKLTEEDLRAMERRQISRLIERLKGSPYKVNNTGKATVRSYGTEMPDVPAGRYALLKTHPGPEAELDAEIGAYDFFEVQKPSEGKWKGRTFLKQLYGSPRDYRKVSVQRPAAQKFMERISQDPAKASLTYGRVSGVCGRCHSPLTNENSLKAGIGPVCASKAGW